MDASEIDPEMAAFMGFSSFGTQPAAKKRKYNHRADAVSSDNSAAAATGANQVAVGPRTSSAPAPVPAVSANADEIDLDNTDNDGPTVDATAAAGSTEDGDQPDEEEGGASLYADRTVAPALAHAQELIDEMTTRGGIASGPDSGREGEGHQTTSLPSLPMRPDASWGREMGVPPVSMPVRGNAGSGSPPVASGGRGGRHQNQHQNRGDGKPWWEGYYDPKSNENPWEKLERAAGIESRGTWVSRASQAQTA